MAQAARIIAIAGGILWIKTILKWMGEKPARNVRAGSIFGREEMKG